MIKCEANKDLASEHVNEICFVNMLNDAVSHPSHYTQGKIEIWDFIVDQKLDYLLGNVCKYICRAGKKSKDTELQDLQKAMAYLNRKIKEIS